MVRRGSRSSRRSQGCSTWLRRGAGRQDAVDALRAFGVTEEQMIVLGLRREDGVRVDMSTQAPAPQVVVAGADDGEGADIDPGEESELAHEGRIQARLKVKNVAAIAPRPGPV